MDDSRWLAQYVEQGSEDAFARLVARHVDLVYSAALRQTRERELAHDVTQLAFIALARKAASLRRETALSAWLLVTTRYLALDALKAQARRRRHERKAAEMAKTIEQAREPAGGGDWDAMAPHLDAALASLNTQDRRAITLRYFEGKSLGEVARLMGTSDEAARQRVHRATTRMRTFFAARAVNVSAAALGPVIVAHGVHAAPPGMAAAATSAALAGHVAAAGALVGSTATATATKGAVLIMASTKAKILGAAAALLLLSGGAAVGYKVIAPPKAQTVVLTPEHHVTAAPSPDWQRRFNEAYALAPGQIVKNVPPPMIPERQMYWDSVQPGHSWKLPPEAAFVFGYNGTSAHWISLGMDGGNFSSLMQMGGRFKVWEIDGSAPMGMQFPGDWVIREGTTRPQLMAAAADLVSQRLGRTVRFEPRKVVREAIVIRGAYHYVPLAGYPDNGKIELVGGKVDGAPPPWEWNGTLKDVFDRIEAYANRKVFDETGVAKKKITCRDHQAFNNTEALLDNIQKQTSFRFDREPREMEVWFMVDDRHPATRPDVSSLGKT